MHYFTEVGSLPPPFNILLIGSIMKKVTKSCTEKKKYESIQVRHAKYQVNWAHKIRVWRIIKFFSELKFVFVFAFQKLLVKLKKRYLNKLTRSTDPEKSDDVMERSCSQTSDISWRHRVSRHSSVQLEFVEKHFNFVFFCAHLTVPHLPPVLCVFVL